MWILLLTNMCWLICEWSKNVERRCRNSKSREKRCETVSVCVVLLCSWRLMVKWTGMMSNCTWISVRWQRTWLNVTSTESSTLTTRTLSAAPHSTVTQLHVAILSLARLSLSLFNHVAAVRRWHSTLHCPHTVRLVLHLNMLSLNSVTSLVLYKRCGFKLHAAVSSTAQGAPCFSDLHSIDVADSAIPHQAAWCYIRFTHVYVSTY